MNNDNNNKLRGDRVPVMIQVPSQMKEWLASLAAQEKISVAECGRRALGAYIGYNYEPERRARPTKYDSIAARKAAAKVQQRDRQQLIKKLLAEYRASNKE